MPQSNNKLKIPLYKQVKNHLVSYISNELKPGDMLPIESELEQMYQVSRVTIRKAIEELVADGVVVKHQGRGTFVQSPKIIQDAGRITSWTEEMRLRGKNPETKDLNIQEIVPSKRLSRKLQLKKSEKVIRIKRIRCVDNEPIAIMVNYLRSEMIPGFLKIGLTSESLYKTLEKEYGIVIEDANELIKAREATDLEALSLKVEPYSPVLHITRLSYYNSVPFELVEMTNRFDRYEYHIQLSGRNKERLIQADREVE